jgi:uncharacterized RDD family membrane protein YckC
VSDYDPGASSGDQPWGPPPPPQQPTGGWGAPPGAGAPPGGPYGGQSYGSPPPPYGSPPPGGAGQQLPPYSQFGSPQQANWGSPAPGVGQLAQWAPRAGGYVIDYLIIFVPSIVLDVLAGVSKSGVFIVLTYVWGIGMWAWFSIQVGMSGSSPGMRVVGLRCVRATTGQLIGGGLGFVRGLINAILFALCIVPGIVSFLWPLWDSQHQTLADKIVGSLVYRAQPEGFSLLPKRPSS